MKTISHRKRKIILTVIIVLAVLVAIRLALPYILLHYANKSLAQLNGYYGHVNDIDLALFRGAYKVDSIFLNKIDSVTGESTPVLSALTIDASLEWRALLHGSIVGEITFDRPVLSFTKDKVEPEDLRRDSATFKRMLDKAMPLQINRIEIRSGTVRYADEGTKPPVDIQLSSLNVVAYNLHNSYDSSSLLPARIVGAALIYDGLLTFEINMNPLASYPTFDLDMELNDTDLAQLNDFFNAYANVDVNKGKFGLYVEVAAKDGSFNGYVKPIIHELDILGKEDQDDNFFRKAWEGIIGSLGELFTNRSEEQVATKIPLQGRLDNPRTGTWVALVNILRNAFISALQPSIDNEINIQTVEGRNKK
jgi:hypothetical protein